LQRQSKSGSSNAPLLIAIILAAFPEGVGEIAEHGQESGWKGSGGGERIYPYRPLQNVRGVFPLGRSRPPSEVTRAPWK
jgi:hypothetical protein